MESERKGGGKDLIYGEERSKSSLPPLPFFPFSVLLNGSGRRKRRSLSFSTSPLRLSFPLPFRHGTTGIALVGNWAWRKKGEWRQNRRLTAFEASRLLECPECYWFVAEFHPG